MVEVPEELGTYWATHIRYGWRMTVVVDKNGQGHTRVFPASARLSGSFGLEEFTDWEGPWFDPKTGARGVFDTKKKGAKQ